METETNSDRLSLSDIRDRATITVEEYGRVMGISRDSAYRAVNSGDAHTLRIGGRILVPVPALLAQLGEVACPVPEAKLGPLKPGRRMQGNELERCRVSAGMTLQEVAVAMHRTGIQVRRWELGHQTPAQDTLLALASLYEVDASDFLLG